MTSVLTLLIPISLVLTCAGLSYQKASTAINTRIMSSKIQLHKAVHSLKLGGLEDGHVDKGLVKLHITDLHNKYKGRGFLERHAGAPEELTADVDLHEQAKGVMWTGLMKVGAGKEVPFLFDSASANLVMNKDAYQPGPDAKDLKQSYKAAYASGQQSTVHVWTDTVHFGELPPIKNVAISWADTNFLGVEGDSDIRGLVGLAFKDQEGATPWGTLFDRIIESKVLKDNVFSFAMSPDGATGELQFGSVSEAATAPPIWTPLVANNQGYWMVDGSINGKNKKMLIDSGTTLILGRPADVIPIFESMQEYIEVMQDPDGTIFAALKDPNVLPDVQIQFGDFSFKLTRQGLVFGKDDQGRPALSIMGAPLVERFPKDVWLIGDALLREVVHTCDYDNRRIGWSPHKGTHLL